MSLLDQAKANPDQLYRKQVEVQGRATEAIATTLLQGDGDGEAIKLGMLLTIRRPKV